MNVTDGGHIENLGAYQLLRRRCRYIIACDAERDTELTLGGLATVVRYARIDMGIKIKFLDDQLDELREGNRHWALGTINYGQGQEGWLLYVKASLTGDENIYIQEYQSRNEDFPHESTADQFFSEEQFEAYRALGHHVAQSIFEETRPELRENEPVASLFEAVQKSQRDDPSGEDPAA